MSSAEPMVRSILPCPSRVTVFQVRQRAGAARVSGRDRRPLAEVGDQLPIYATAQPFDIHGVNQELGARRRPASAGSARLIASSVNFCQRSVTTK